MSVKTVTLNTILEVQNGFAFKTEFFSDTKGIPLIRIRDLASDKTEARYTGEFREEFFVDQGDILVGMDGNFRCVRWKGPRALLNQRVCRLRNFSRTVLPEYVFYGIQRKLRDIEDKTAFATVKHISARQIREIALPLPDISEQRRRVEQLAHAESIMRLRSEAQRTAAHLVPALFCDAFGDPATNPRGWPIVRLGDALSAADYGSSKKGSDSGSGLPLIRMGNVRYDGSLELADLKFVELAPSEAEKYRLVRGDLLFNRTNSKELVGKTGIWDGSRDAIVASYFIRLRVDRARLNPFYLWAFMNSSHMKRTLVATARGAIGQANINSRELRALPIPLPPLDKQREFERRCSEVGDLSSQMAIASEKAHSAFASLLGRMFT